MTMIFMKLLAISLFFLFVIFFLLQLEDGDIICYQRLLQVDNSQQCRYPDVPSFLEYVHNRQVYI